MDVTVATEDDLIRVRFHAAKSGSGHAELDLPRRLLLYRYDAFATAAVWSVKILAEDGADVLEGAMVGLPSGAGSSGHMTGEIDAGLGYRPLIVGPGRYMVEVSADGASDGEALIWMRPA